MDYPWYTIVENSDDLLQGDFVPECPVIIPPPSVKSDDEPTVDIFLMDSVILSQSCDLSNNKIDNVLVCPVFPLNTFIGLYFQDAPVNKKDISKLINNLRTGHLPAYHLLNKYDGYLHDYQVVDFRNVYGIHISSLKSICLALEKRLRLLPPYREHLSQAFARYFMRVGLPEDISVEGY